MNEIFPNVDCTYEENERRYMEEFQPVGPVEEELVRSVAHHMWRVRQFSTLEIGVLLRQETDMRAVAEQMRTLNKLGRASDAHSCMYRSSLKLLLKLQAERMRTPPARGSKRVKPKAQFTSDGATIQ